MPNAEPVFLLSNIVDAISDHDAQFLDDLGQLIEERRNSLRGHPPVVGGAPFGTDTLKKILCFQQIR